MPVPNTFANATTSIPLSQLDANFATAITLGNTSIQLGNTVTTLNNMTLSNVTITTGNVTVSNATVGGNLAFTSTGQRITGDMSNATLANRLMFQTSTANSSTVLGVLPNGSGQVGQVNLFGGSDPANTSFLSILCATSISEARITSGINGSGTYLPITFYTGGSERARIDSSGNVGIGTSSPSYKLEVRATAGGVGAVIAGANDGGNAQINVNSTFSSTSPVYGFFFNGTTGIGNPASNVISAITAGTETMRIDSSGNVGIGTSAPTDKLQVNTQDGVRLGASGAVSYARIGSANTGESTAQISYDRSTGATIISQGNTGSALNERMRIDNSGNLLVGTTTGVSNHRFNVNPAGTNSAAAFAYGSTAEAVNIYNTGNQSYTAIRFLNNAFATVVGSITCSTSTTAYNTSSDYRLKENIKAMAGGLSTISSLKPVTYNWISDNSVGEGFIAHELAEHIPLAVTGKKDAVNEDGSIKPQGVDYSKIVVHLVAAIQELSAKVAALEAKP